MTINDSNIDLDKFPTSKVRQLAKKIESSKAITRHIKQVENYPQVAQINHVRYQCTDLPARKHKKKRSFVKPRPPSHKNDASDRKKYPHTSLDTCTYANIMPASVYKLVFNDPELKKLAPRTLEIVTYTTDTVKIVGSCLFYLVHLDTKK